MPFFRLVFLALFFVVVVAETSANNPTPDACVTLLVYKNQQCSGAPVVQKFPTWSAPGSSCYHDHAMGHMSVQDQYCDLQNGFWHQKVFMGSEKCAKSWWSPSIDLTFTADKCVGGYKLQSCVFAPCDEELWDEVPPGDVSSVGEIIKVKTMLRQTNGKEE